MDCVLEELQMCVCGIHEGGMVLVLWLFQVKFSQLWNAGLHVVHGSCWLSCRDLSPPPPSPLSCTNRKLSLLSFFLNLFASRQQILVVVFDLSIRYWNCQLSLNSIVVVS